MVDLELPFYQVKDSAKILDSSGDSSEVKSIPFLMTPVKSIWSSRLLESQAQGQRSRKSQIRSVQPEPFLDGLLRSPYTLDQRSKHRWKPFVANRVREINPSPILTRGSTVPGKDNPADLLTRGISVDALTTNSDWNGSSFLRQN
ncbi:hypothetical protein TNCV_310201 [Trichonephila clavipes]|nr:hypothetical protein TNCV_310201 [Trichonephila clavipes]